MFSFCELGERIFLSGYTKNTHCIIVDIEKILSRLEITIKRRVSNIVDDFHISRTSYVLIL